MAQKENTDMFELLAPAGSPAILEAVIRAGADAVYLGGDRYGARAYADNFSQEQLLWALDYAHIRGRKIYLTVNTLLKNNETDGLCDYIAPLYERGLDAVLVQDFGVLHIVREIFPDLPIHASTQMTLTGADGVRFLQEQGVQRAVLSRELSLEEADRIHEETGMELEVFVHGALCYCYSGQCLFSGMLGGRSGNRGRCAQPCRLPYSVSDEHNGKLLQESYILSMKDLCGMKDLPALHQAGVYSLKIEGRMKQETYAAGVVSYYRKYIDYYVSQISEGKFAKEQSASYGKKFSRNRPNAQNITIAREDEQALSALGSRCGFTDSYYRKQNGGDMITYNKPNYTANTPANTHKSSVAYDDGKIQIYGHAVFHKERPSELSVWIDENYSFDFKGDNFCRINDTAKTPSAFAAVTGPAPDKAQKAPAYAEDLRQRLMKTGDTPFVFAELTVDAEEDLFVPNGAVNHLRRDALEQLEKAILAPYMRKFIREDRKLEDVSDLTKKSVPLNKSISQQESPRLAALVSSLDQLAAVLADGRMTDLYLETAACPREELLKNLFHCLSMIEESGQNYTVYLALPPIFRQHTREFYTSIAQELPAVQGFLVRNYEEFAWAGRHFPMAERIIDHHLYTYNNASVCAFFAAGADRNTVPLELNRSEIFGRDNRCSEMVVYGRYPLMLSAQCIHANSDRNGRGCDKCSVITTLTDRRGALFPVRNFCSECVNVIYNSVPTMLFGRMKELEQNGIKSFRLEFTIENSKEVSDILAGLPMEKFMCGAGIPAKIHSDRFAAHTNGHYTRGVE